jgi:hypothetical protein
MCDVHTHTHTHTHTNTHTHTHTHTHNLSVNVYLGDALQGHESLETKTHTPHKHTNTLSLKSQRPSTFTTSIHCIEDF